LTTETRRSGSATMTASGTASITAAKRLLCARSCRRSSRRCNSLPSQRARNPTNSRS